MNAGQARLLDIRVSGYTSVQMHCVEAGHGEPGVVLLHGFTFNADSWRDVLPALAARGRVVAYDRIPFGRSQKLVPGDWGGKNPYTPDATLAQLDAVLDETGLERVILVGNSAGGLLAARAALAWPERVAGLILVCPAILDGPPASASGGLDNRFMNWVAPKVLTRIDLPGRVLKRSFHDPARIDAARLARTTVAARDPDWAKALWEFVKVSTAQPDISGQLTELRQPVLIVGGESDRVVAPARQRELAAALPDAELVSIPAAGHLPHEEQPEEFLRVVGDWLDRTGV